MPVVGTEAKLQRCCRDLEKEFNMGQRDTVLFSPPEMTMEEKRYFYIANFRMRIGFGSALLTIVSNCLNNGQCTVSSTNVLNE